MASNFWTGDLFSSSHCFLRAGKFGQIAVTVNPFYSILVSLIYLFRMEVTGQALML